MRTKDSKFKKRVKQNIYKYHKYLAFFTIVPVLFWSLSGIMHPMMSNFLGLDNEFIIQSKICIHYYHLHTENNTLECVCQGLCFSCFTKYFFLL